MTNEKRNVWSEKIFPILSSTLFGSVVGVIVDFFTSQSLTFTVIFGVTGLLVGVVQYLIKRKKSKK